MIYGKEFNLTEAIVNDEVDLIFGESKELLEEISHIRGRNNMQIIIRNSFEDTVRTHGFSIKFIPSRNIKGDYNDGRKGIPITFHKLVKQIEGESIEYPSEWKIILGGSKDGIVKAKQLQNELNKREKDFISAVVKELGIIILEYWDLDPMIQFNIKD